MIFSEFGLLIGPAGEISDVIARAVAAGIALVRKEALAAADRRSGGKPSKEQCGVRTLVLTGFYTSQPGYVAKATENQHEALSKHASYFTIGFARLIQRNGAEDAVSAGSGTLVTVGSLHGILTAAHVTETLPKDGNVGLILNLEGREQYQKLVINMGRTEPPVMMQAQQFGPLGPDLAFLRLTDEACWWLKAQCSFYSLSKRRDGILSYRGPTNSNTDSITGIIHKLTEKVGSRRGVRRINFYAIFSPVRISAMRYPDAHDLIYVQMATEREPTFKIPGSFEGTSGGGVWRYYLAEKDGKYELTESRLIGVPFHQSFTADGKREITCHGPKASTDRW